MEPNVYDQVSDRMVRYFDGKKYRHSGCLFSLKEKNKATELYKSQGLYVRAIKKKNRNWWDVYTSKK